MKTSNSSRQRKGASMASHSDMMKQTVEKERSPPERDLVFLVAWEAREWASTCTCRRNSLPRSRSTEVVTLFEFVSCSIQVTAPVQENDCAFSQYLNGEFVFLVVDSQLSLVASLLQQVGEVEAGPRCYSLLQNLITLHPALQTLVQLLEERRTVKYSMWEWIL